MELQYPISFNGENVGFASLTRQGMFWLIRCRLQLQCSSPAKIIVLSGKQKLDLGICVTYPDGCGLDCRVPVKQLAAEELHFTMEAQRRENWLPVSADQQFPALRKLATAKFMMQNGKPGISITD